MTRKFSPPNWQKSINMTGMLLQKNTSQHTVLMLHLDFILPDDSTDDEIVGGGVEIGISLSSWQNDSFAQFMNKLGAQLAESFGVKFRGMIKPQNPACPGFWEKGKHGSTDLDKQTV